MISSVKDVEYFSIVVADNGNGGRGGHGGGGGGGPSIGIFQSPTSSATVNNNSFTLGNGGAGGSSAGNSGEAGERVNVKQG